MDESFRLKSCPKHYTLDQDKAVAPKDTVKTALQSLKKAYDLSHLKIEAREDVIEGAYSFTGFSDQLKNSGKGLTKEQSRASAIMEFAERYFWLHFDYKSYDGYVQKSYNEIKKGDIPTVDESYFLYHFIGLENKKELLEEIKDIPLKWIKGESLIDHNKFYYPINWHNYNFSSNGLAAGNAIEETIFQALCELIERENVYRLFVEKKVGNDIDLKSIKTPLAKKVLENAKKAGIEIIIKDISFDFRIPTIIVHGICEADRNRLTYKGCGYGAHTDPEKALVRALSEYFEGFSLLRKKEKEVDIKWERIIPYLPKKNYGFLPLYNQEMLYKKKKTLKISDIPNLSRPDIKDEDEYILMTLKNFGYNVILVNKTIPAFNIPMVRLFAPKMRSLISTEIETPLFMMAEVHYEAGNEEASQKYLNKYWEKTFFNPPTGKIAPYGRVVPKVKKAFKKDYLETIKNSSTAQKDVVKTLEKYLKMYEDSIKI